ncbi:hypothetical protein [Nonomuraea longicatena]|uniref:Uncharacterized protein n=1 Tax=Nonomuraea longicatena TaxID=83682 RepID=A0ABP4AJL1_9ACTN
MRTAQPVEPARSFYLLEESMCVIGETGYFRAYTTLEELRARLAPKLSHSAESNDFLLGESVNVWTVQRGRLTAGLDVTELVDVRLPSGPVTVSALNRHRHDFTGGRRADPPPSDSGATLVLDWAALAARLPPLAAPPAVPGDKDLVVRFDGPHPAPGILSYLDDLVAQLADEDLRRSLFLSLDYETPFTL